MVAVHVSMCTDVLEPTTLAITERRRHRPTSCLVLLQPSYNHHSWTHHETAHTSPGVQEKDDLPSSYTSRATILSQSMRFYFICLRSWMQVLSVAKDMTIVLIFVTICGYWKPNECSLPGHCAMVQCKLQARCFGMFRFAKCLVLLTLRLSFIIIKALWAELKYRLCNQPAFRSVDGISHFKLHPQTFWILSFISTWGRVNCST